MPVAKLLVESELDAVIVSAILHEAMPNAPLVERAGSKSLMRSLCKREQELHGCSTAYVRDRDFDFEPDATGGPVEIPGGAKGWHWNRHEMENYLLEPDLLSAAFPAFKVDEYRAELTAAAERIRFYEAARWTVGRAKSAMPAPYTFGTRSANTNNEFLLPAQLSEPECEQWVISHGTEYRQAVDCALDAGGLKAEYAAMVARLDSRLCSDLDGVLTWFSGKDLMAGIEPWLIGELRMDAHQFRAAVRTWVERHPHVGLHIHTEWAQLARLLSA